MTSRPSASPPTPATAFVRLGANGRPETDPAGRILLLPGVDLPLVPVDLPRGLRGQARDQVAWRYLRDQMGLDHSQVEMRPLTLSAAGRKPDTWDRVLMVDASRMRQWRQTGAAARAILPDYLALPAAPDLWVVCTPETSSDMGVQARFDLTDGFSCDADMAPLMLTRALEDLPPPRALLHLGTSAPWLDTLMEKHEIALVRDPGALAPLGVTPPQVLGHGELACDLRTDPRAARDRLRRRVLPWRWPALAAMLAAALWTVDQSLQIRHLEQGTAQIHSEITQITRDYFVPNGPILDVRAQVSRSLAAAQADARANARQVSPLVLFGQVADVIRATGAQPELASYTATEGLEMELRLDDFAAVDRLVAALAAAGITTDLRDARAGNGENTSVRIALRLTPTTGDAQDG